MRRTIKRRPAIEGDLVYGSAKVSKLANYLMEDGKKTAARKIVYQALDLAAKETKLEPMEVLETAIRNVAPTMEVRSRRIGGANYQVPREVRPERKLQLAYRWLIEAASSKKGAPMHKKLADELIAATKNDGAAVKKKEDTHRMAEANKAFAHFTW